MSFPHLDTTLFRLAENYIFSVLFIFYVWSSAECVFVVGVWYFFQLGWYTQLSSLLCVAEYSREGGRQKKEIL